MPPSTWKHAGRRDIFILQNEYHLCDQEVFDIVGRLYGEEWRKQGRKKYNLADIRDEGKYRWSPGKRHAGWNEIDPVEVPHCAEERARRIESHDRIQKAAAISTDGNVLTGDVNIRITLRPKSGYARDPETFRPRESKKNKKNAIPVDSSRADSPQQSFTSSSHQNSTSSIPPPRERSTEHVSFAIPGGRRPLQLAMFHAKKLRTAQAGLVSLPLREPISRGSQIYQYGGPIFRTLGYITQEEEDVLVCNEGVCATCQRDATQLHDDELIEGVDLDESPTAGMPFVHMGRDTQVAARGRRFFTQTSQTPIPETAVPSKTKRAQVHCKHAGEWRLFEVLTCVQEECETCHSDLPASRAMLSKY